MNEVFAGIFNLVFSTNFHQYALPYFQPRSPDNKYQQNKPRINPQFGNCFLVVSYWVRGQWVDYLVTGWLGSGDQFNASQIMPLPTPQLFLPPDTCGCNLTSTLLPEPLSLHALHSLEGTCKKRDPFKLNFNQNYNQRSEARNTQRRKILVENYPMGQSDCNGQ